MTPLVTTLEQGIMAEILRAHAAGLTVAQIDTNDLLTLLEMVHAARNVGDGKTQKDAGTPGPIL